MKKHQISSDKALAMHVSVVSIVVNLLLCTLKLIAGIVAKSGAMVSDAVHSASDVFSTFIVMAGINISSKAADHEHPYGHDRMECIASCGLAVALALTGLGIGKKGLENIFSRDPEALVIPGVLALIAAVVSIIVKEWMYWYTRAAAKKINSGALMADAWHHRSDALSSIGAFVGILGARLGFPIADALASLVICLFIIKAAWDIGSDAVNRMVDHAGSDEINQKIFDTVKNIDGVIHVDMVKTRLFGAKVYVDLEISADANITLAEAHRIAHLAHDAVEKSMPEVKHCMVHVNPA